MLSGILVQDSECAHQHEKPKRRIKSPYKEEKVRSEAWGQEWIVTKEREKRTRVWVDTGDRWTWFDDHRTLDWTQQGLISKRIRTDILIKTSDADELPSILRDTHISHPDAAFASPKDPTRSHLCLPGPIQLTSSKPNSQIAPLHFKYYLISLLKVRIGFYLHLT